MAAATRTVDDVFTMLSPWASIGHGVLADICRRRGAATRFRPVSLTTVFPESGGLPVARRHPSRQAYRLVELQRWRERRGPSFALHPRFWPCDPGLADRAVVAQAGADPDRFVAAGFSACWEGGRDPTDPRELRRLLDEAGHDGEIFWGQDRLDLLDDALSSGRPPLTT